MESRGEAEGRLEERFVGGRIALKDAARRQYSKSYGLAGNHSGVQICLWNKKSIQGHRGCYKVKFYGIDCHRCAQMSPALAWCSEACVFCWRPMEWMKRTALGEDEVDEPDFIIAETVKARRKLVSGIKGGPKCDLRKFNEAFKLFPSHWAISLSGEPTIYPKLGRMIRKLRENPEVRTVFLVTNGQEPERLAQLSRDESLPTQLYISLAAPNEELFGKINRSVHKDGWARLMRSLELMAGLPCRRVIRLTLIKGLNDADDALAGYSALISKSKADFVEVKSYMALGFSRKRLGPDFMAEHWQVMQFAKSLVAEMPDYRIEDDDEISRIVLLKRKDSPFGNIIANK
ncbi:4-demethylwyosine synthase TYW1 [Candidatus Micrarchaeota archaeon]|nr:4-demethylwyosine synthase TYW1 [Candidatus Micrarchaeota archaeon]